MIICWILEGVHAKNLEATILFVDFPKAFDSIHRENMGQILLAYSLPKETIVAIMVLYRNTTVKGLLPGWKLSKLDKPDMWDTAEEVGMNL